MTDMIWVYGSLAILGSLLFTWGALVLALRFCARASGWTALAKHYAKDFPNSSTPRSIRYLGLGRRAPLAYNNAMRARLQNGHLYLRPIFLARSNHPPLAIPLADLDFGHDIPKLGKTRIANVAVLPEQKIWFLKADADWIRAAQSEN